MDFLHGANEQLRDQVFNFYPVVEELKDEPEESVAASQSRKSGNEGKKLPPIRVKILSGTDRLDSAKVLFSRVLEHGLDVERIAIAPRSDFQGTTIYYVPQEKSLAFELAALLGGHCTVKTLSWRSVFDLILVSGHEESFER